jgi:hypothetical protein
MNVIPQFDVTIMQPGYLPWPGFFDLIHMSKTFVVYDTARYTKATWRNRNRCRINRDDGWQWLTVPVEGDSECKKIKDVKIAEGNWQKKHLAVIREHYRGAAYFDAVFPELEAILNKPWTYILDLDMATVDFLSSHLSGLIGTKFVVASELKLSEEGTKTGKLIEICKALGAETLYDTEGALAFFDHEEFAAANLRASFQNYSAPVYKQAYEPFVPALSTLDVVMNCGPNSGRVIFHDV